MEWCNVGTRELRQYGTVAQNPRFVLRLCLALAGLAIVARPALAIGQAPYGTTTLAAGSVPRVTGQATAAIVVDANDWAGVLRAAGDLQADIRRVTGLTPTLLKTAVGLPRTVVIIGTIGR